MAMQHPRITPFRAPEYPNLLELISALSASASGFHSLKLPKLSLSTTRNMLCPFPPMIPTICIENWRREPGPAQFEELLPIYATLVGCGIRQSTEERHKFVRLARLKLESLQRKRPKLRKGGEWDWLEAQLAKVDQKTGEPLREHLSRTS